MKADLSKIQKNYAQAIEEIDGKLAFLTIKEIKVLLAETNLEKTNPSFHQKLQKAISYLKLVAISFISDEEAEKIIQSNYLGSFEIDVSMENLLTSKLFSYPYLVRDEIRKKLKVALSKNEQPLGNLPLKDFVLAFDKEYNPRSRSLSAGKEFAQKSITTSKLNPKEKVILSKVLHTYNYLLCVTLPATGHDLEVLLKSMDTPINASFVHQKEQSKNVPSKISSLPLNQALNDYPEIGEQLVTSARIKIKGFPDLVLPSVKNWVYDYKLSSKDAPDTLLKINNYLFKNANTSQLNEVDRSKLYSIFKAFEEKLPLQVDIANKKIIFPKTNLGDATYDLKQKVETETNFQKNNVTNTHFSSPQKLPSESFSSRQKIKIKPPVKKHFDPTPDPIKEKVHLPSQSMSTNFQDINRHESRNPVSTLKPTEKKLSFSEELHNLRKNNSQSKKNSSDSDVNVVNLKDLQ